MLVNLPADERLKQLGFFLVKQDDLCGYLIYENPIEDHRVELDYDGEEWFIHSGSISKIGDYDSVEIREPMGMKYNECKLFLAKIDELNDDKLVNVVAKETPTIMEKDERS